MTTRIESTFVSSTATMTRLCISLLLGAIGTSRVNAQYTNTTEVWLAARATDGGGNVVDPRSADTSAKLDAIFAAFAAQTNVTFRFFPGDYYTKGFSPSSGVTDKWQPNHGWRLIGAGMEKTILHRSNTYTNNLTANVTWNVIGNGFSLADQRNRVEVRDMTVDCGGHYGTTYFGTAWDAVRLAGNECKIVNVRAIHWAGYSAASPAITNENFILSIWLPSSGTPGTYITNALIEGCRVELPTYPVITNRYTTCLFIGGGTGTNFMQVFPTIRNNYVDVGSVNTNAATHGCTVNTWQKGGVIENNYLRHLGVGVYADTGSFQDVVVRDNIMQNMLHYGVFYNFSQDPLTYTGDTAVVSGNYIQLNPTVSLQQVGISFNSSAANDRRYTNVWILNNYIGYPYGLLSSSAVSTPINLQATVNGRVENNNCQVSTGVADPISINRYKSVTTFNNRDTDGTLYPGRFSGTTNHQAYKYTPEKYVPTLATNSLDNGDIMNAKGGSKVFFTKRLSATTTITVSNIVEGAWVYLHLENPGAHTVTFSGIPTDSWYGGGIPPALPAISTNIFGFVALAGRTNAVWIH